MADPNDDIRLTGETEAQSEETIMPWVWWILGVVVIALFVIWTVSGGSVHRMREAPAVAPVKHQSY